MGCWKNGLQQQPVNYQTSLITRSNRTFCGFLAAWLIINLFIINHFLPIEKNWEVQSSCAQLACRLHERLNWRKKDYVAVPYCALSATVQTASALHFHLCIHSKGKMVNCVMHQLILKKKKGTASVLHNFEQSTPKCY